MITVALIPLAPGEELTDRLPITSQVANGKTIWTLPTASRALSFVTSIEACSVLGNYEKMKETS